MILESAVRAGLKLELTRSRVIECPYGRVSGCPFMEMMSTSHATVVAKENKSLIPVTKASFVSNN